MNNAAERTCSGECLIKSVWTCMAFLLRRNIFVSIRPFIQPSEADKKLFYRFVSRIDNEMNEIGRNQTKTDENGRNLWIFIKKDLYLENIFKYNWKYQITDKWKKQKKLKWNIYILIYTYKHIYTFQQKKKRIHVYFKKIIKFGIVFKICYIYIKKERIIKYLVNIFWKYYK